MSESQRESSEGRAFQREGPAREAVLGGSRNSRRSICRSPVTKGGSSRRKSRREEGTREHGPRESLKPRRPLPLERGRNWRVLSEG